MPASNLTDHQGLVIVSYGQKCLVENDNHQQIPCATRKNKVRPIAGDIVSFQSTGPNSGIVTAIEKRRTILTRPDQQGRLRPVAANIDQIVIVIACEPEFSTLMIDQYLAAAEIIDTSACIIINKQDLLSEIAFRNIEQQLSVYQTLDYPCLFTSTTTVNGMTALHQQLKDKTSILVGQSGVGKSSLATALLPDIDIRTGSLSKVTGLGRHTTTAATLYHLAGGGSLIDSPGVREFGLGSVSSNQLMSGFREFQAYLGLCKFNNCRHLTEPGCAVTHAVRDGKINQERHLHYQQLAKEISRT